MGPPIRTTSGCAARRRSTPPTSPGDLLTALLTRRDLGAVYSLVAPKLLGGTTRAEWISGKHLPLKARPGAEPAGKIVAFSGPRSAGIVSAYSAGFGEPNHLYAVRVELVDGRWVATYVHEGHAAPFVDETTFAPPGFLPGSAVTGLWWWVSIPSVLHRADRDRRRDRVADQEGRCRDVNGNGSGGEQAQCGELVGSDSSQAPAAAFAAACSGFVAPAITLATPGSRRAHRPRGRAACDRARRRTPRASPPALAARR